MRITDFYSSPEIRTGFSAKYKPYHLQNFHELPQLRHLSKEHIFEMEVVAQVFPFRTNNYVVNELIKWDDIPNDPMFRLTFPQKDMLRPDHFDQIAQSIKKGLSKSVLVEQVLNIRKELNPHPAGQLGNNVPSFENRRLSGMQHKYRETVLFFPAEGQTCHAFCTFCFRWPQFVHVDDWKFSSREIELLIAYLRENPTVTDLLFTGGDPMIMTAKTLGLYLEAIIRAKSPNLQNIRIGSKALSYWPYRFLSDRDSEPLLDIFRKVVDAGFHLCFMANFTHPVELSTLVVREAIKRIQGTGAVIRTQSPILKDVNDNSRIWAKMWRQQVKLGCVPYYMFIPRDTGAQRYFAVTLENAWQVFRGAYQQVTGLSRTVRGPCMSCHPGKLQILGVVEIQDQKFFSLRFLQGRNPDWVHRPFFAQYNKDAIWLSDLKPAFNKEKFFFEAD